MIKGIIGKVWRRMPGVIRVKLVRVMQKKFTVSVGAVVTNELNQVLLLDHVFRPGSGWGIPGGFIEHGEQIDEAIRRELMEETGLELENVRIYHTKTSGQHLEFLVRATGKGTAEVKSIEIKRLGWFDTDKLPEKMGKAQKEIILEVLSKDAK